MRSFYECKEKPDGTVTVEDQIDSISMYDLQGPFDEAIENLKKEKERFESEYHKRNYVRIYLDYATPEFDDEKRLIVIGERLLNEEEMKGYRKFKEDQKMTAEQRARQDFERLKKMFPNG